MEMVTHAREAGEASESGKTRRKPGATFNVILGGRNKSEPNLLNIWFVTRKYH
jgi:hypothetical protein